MSNKHAEHWKKLLAPMRWHSQQESDIATDRSPFMMDFDRIIFSSSYRRLGRKTQVHPLSRNDHIHNRLSHSQEVSCVGRSLGSKVGSFLAQQKYLPAEISVHDVGTIVQCAALIHDIGNPPFGHAGEEAIRDWFKSQDNAIYLDEHIFLERELADFKAFDGNAQGFRVINCVEMYKNDGGLRLSFPTIASMVKYPRSAHEALGRGKPKFNYYQSEKEYFSHIFDVLGLKFGNHYIRHPLSYLTEAADDICYRIIDMEDARELNIITLEEIFDVCTPIYQKLNLDERKMNSLPSARRKSGYLRAKLISYLVESIAETYIQNFEAIMTGDITNLISISDGSIQEYFERAESLFFNTIAKDRTKITLELGSYSLYKRLLDVFIPAVFHQKTHNKLSFKEERALDLMGNNSPCKTESFYVAYRCVIDFISGMTDDYATYISQQLSGTSS